MKSWGIILGLIFLSNAAKPEEEQPIGLLKPIFRIPLCLIPNICKTMPCK